MLWRSAVTVLVLYVVGRTASVDRIQLYPFGVTHGDARLDVGDDVSSPEVKLQTPVVFYDEVYSSLYVNLNGHISFQTDLPVYRSNFVLPFGYRIIAVFLADVDIRLSGNVFYRETGDPSLLARAADEITSAFPDYVDFQPESLFIATWNDVGYYDSHYDQTNTFQLMIASDGRESFVSFIYADTINWVQGDGKDPQVASDVPAQVGFDAGDDVRYFTLPGSGMPQVTELAQRSNVDVNGIWRFRVGYLHGNNVHGPGSDEHRAENGQGGIGGTGSCAVAGADACNVNARCVDYSGGFCCHCNEPYIGNGHECIRPGEPQRISGKVTGRVNDVTIDNSDLHAYVITVDGRTYVAFDNIEPTIGYSLQGAYVIGSILGFLFAVPQQPNMRRTIEFTGLRLNRTALVRFESTGDILTIRQTLSGQDAQGHMRMSIYIEGRVPDVGADQTVEIGDYVNEYQRVAPGQVKAFSTQTVRVDSVERRFTVDETILYNECPYQLADDFDKIRVSVARSFVVYDPREKHNRYSQMNNLPGSALSDPCMDARCDLNADCVPQQTTYQCVCKIGFEGTGQRCQDVNECSMFPSPCHENAECINSRGSYQCRCFPGFSGDGRNCFRDGQSCDVLRNCDVNARCVYDDSQRSYTCVCNTGYEGNGYNCRLTGAGGDCNDVAGLCDVNAQCLYDDRLQRYACRCNRGFDGDGQFCTRTDCRRDPGVCHINARCDRRGVESVCVCMPGYRGDGYDQCVGTMPTSSMLIYAQGMYIMNVPFSPSPGNHGGQTLYIPGQTAIGVDVDCFTQYVYWTDVSGRAISRAKLDGTDSDVIVQRLGSPEGVAVDWISKNLYWTDSGTDRIEVSRLDGTHHKTLFSDNLVNPRAIGVDPVRGVMFWTDWNRESPKIERANMDGTGRQTVVSEDLGLPNGLTIDYQLSQICWADAGTHKVECAGYDGRGRRTITDSAEYPFGLAFHNGVLYWTDWHRKTLPNIGKSLAHSTSDDLELPEGANGRLYGINVVRQNCPSGSNPCNYNNGGCRFLCLPTSTGGRTCACPDDIDPDECNRISLL